MNKKTLFLLLLAGALVVVSGCEEPGEPIEPIEPDELPAEVEAWIEKSKDSFGAQTMEHEGLLYLLVTYGEKPTGGYTVEFTDLIKEDDRVDVTAYFTEPGDDDIVIQVITYPYALAVIEDPGKPVEFIATGAEAEVPVRE